MYDVFFYEAFAEEAEAMKRFMPEEIKAGYTWQTIQESKHTHPPAGLISIRTQSRIPIEWQDKLTGILSRSTGYDHIIDYWKIAGKHLPAGYLPLYCHRSVAEQAMLLWMALLRKLPQQMENFLGFHRDGLTGAESRGKRMLVVGVGNIGSEIVAIGNGLGMEVRGVDIVEKFEEVNYVSINNGVSWADIIVCAMNLTDKNHGYFHYDLLKQARPEALFINIARGELSPAADLLRLVKEGSLGGLALDVYNHESELAVNLRNKTTSDDKEVQAILELSQYPNVIFTPHNAFNTLEAVMRKSEHSVKQTKQFLSQGKFLWPVPLE